ncbi:hypothetical protein SPBR_05468 [Sporothrix brasiliensis 5110]|uniref:PhoD-like phosphatase domain-containing protein n=1 Tax=Sporothrix brasiliensis 5110 TaxID=1398154 RepID=A0A0C2IZA3_9PEZI|nr:uncharacterized protein SPBR_05468 [Sporothrix brasiliensis 5110]KIH94451.1 hypothetical protein SPBR_05468 [Sporothrix brasiliensis 5110]
MGPYWGNLPDARDVQKARDAKAAEAAEAAAGQARNGPSAAPSGLTAPDGQTQPQGHARLPSLDTMAQLQPKPNRASIQTAHTTNTDAPTESTMSPFVSPTSPQFPDQGLAPRPPSFPYNGAAAAAAAASLNRPSQRHQRQLSQDSADRSFDRNNRRRDSRDQSEDVGYDDTFRGSQEPLDDLDKGVDPPPAAPDVPRGPPLSYRPPGYAVASSAYPPVSSSSPHTPRSMQRPEVSLSVDAMAVDGPGQYYVSAPVAAPAPRTAGDGRSRNPVDPNASPGTRRRPSVSGGARPQPASATTPRRSQSGTETGLGLGSAAPQDASGTAPPRRRVSTGGSPADRTQKKFDEVRSPLQKLELTLDSITKEEKRARVAAAEQAAREKERRRTEAGSQQQRQQSSQQYAQQARSQARPHQPARQQQPQPQPLPQQQQPQHQPQQQQVRFRDRAPPAIDGEPRPLLQPEMSPVEESYLPIAAAAAASAQRGNPPQYDTDGTPPPPPPDSEKPRNLPQQTRIVPSGSGIPQRNLSFRERAAHGNVRLPQADEQSPTLPTQAVAPNNAVPHRQNSARSGKLQKEPPSDLRYTQPQNAYPAAQPHSAQPPAGGVPAEAIPRTMPTDLDAALLRGRSQQEPPPAPQASTYQFPPQQPAKLVKSPSQRKAPANSSYPNRAVLQAANGTFDGSYNSPVDNSVNNNAAEDAVAASVTGVAGASGAASAAAAESSADAPLKRTARFGQDVIDNEPEPSLPTRGDRHFDDPHHHRFSNMVYRARNNLQPGQGKYNPPNYLDEWKQGTVGTLAAGLLDLSDKTSPSADRDKAWWEKSKRRGSASTAPPRPRKGEAFDGEYDEANGPSRFKPPLHLVCGPLLRYCGMRKERSPSRGARNGSRNQIAEREFWRGSVMIVTRDTDSSYEIAPTLRLFSQPLDVLPPPPSEVEGTLSPEYVDPLVGHPKLGRNGETLYVRPVEHLEQAKDLSRDESDEGLFEKTKSPVDGVGPAGQAVDLPGSFADRLKKTDLDGEKAGKFKDVRGFRLHFERGVTFWRFNIEVELLDKQQRIAYRINRGPATGFWVPAKGQSMHIMFYSCNGFSLSVKPDEFSGPDPMWRDVLNNHQTQPFHVMIGGGDQLYNDAIMNQTTIFQEWLTIRNPLTKGNMPFTPEMQDEMEEFYLNRYAMWFSQGLFSLANSQIPMVNMYDDHDIIDGFGSYPQHFMQSPVFAGLGNVAFKYYMLFQHQSVIGETEESEPSWILGQTPGPYINEVSRSTFMHLGAKVALLAVDCRTERTREEVLREDTWKRIVDRCYKEIEKGQTEHLLVQLGIPIAYPRLVWLENILTSRLMEPVKLLGKTGILGNFLNHFDGGVEILDDLDDHWTAKNHKDERKVVIEDLQDLAADRSVRITILSGDVHLAAIGQFYSNSKQGLAKHKDFRYMPNVISSAIANTPPPDIMADILNKRNKVHHFDKETDEDMIPLFGHGVDGKPRNNKTLLPHRNWCSIQPYAPGDNPDPAFQHSGLNVAADDMSTSSRGNFFMRTVSFRRNPYNGNSGNNGDLSRPPISGGGGSLLRRFSRGRQSVDSVQRPVVPNNGVRRSFSLARANPSNLFRRLSSRRQRRPDDGGINGSWGPDSEEALPQQQYEQAANQQAYQQERYPPPQQQQQQQQSGAPPIPGKIPVNYANGQGHNHGQGHGRGYDQSRRRGVHPGQYPDDQSTISSEEDVPGAPASGGQSQQARIRGGAGSPSDLASQAYDEYENGDEGYFSVKRRPAGPGRSQTAPDMGATGFAPHQQQQRAPQASGGTLPTMSDAADGSMGGSMGPPTRPFYRTPTGLTARQMKKAEKYEVNLEGGLDIRLNVEVNPKDPSGITVPYRLVVPRLWYTYESDPVAGAMGGGKVATAPTGIKRLLSIGRRKPSLSLPPPQPMQQVEPLQPVQPIQPIQQAPQMQQMQQVPPETYGGAENQYAR